MASRAKSRSDPETSTEPYALSITALGDWICVETAGTEFLGWAGEGEEIRQATPYDDTRPWQLFKEIWAEVDDRSEFLEFLASGGHGIVTREIISAWWPEFFVPIDCFRYSQEFPFLGSEYLPPGAEDRHPPQAIRKRVLARDEYRCRLCGYSPDDHPAIKLEIHHVAEQALGGLTIENNLITLCKNCHENATPPDAWLRADMFDKIAIAASRFHRRSHVQGVAAYRTWASRILKGKKASVRRGEPLEDLIFDVTDASGDRLRSDWRFAYQLLAGNSLARWFTAQEWRRKLMAELKRK